LPRRAAVAGHTVVAFAVTCRACREQAGEASNRAGRERGRL